MCGREPTEPGRPGGTPDLEDLAGAVRGRLSGARLSHVEAVVETARGIAASGGWTADVRDAAERGAWIHDATKQEPVEAWVRRIEAGGESPDPWALERAPHLLHAQAAAVWARERGERDPRVLAAVRHHPTAHPDWDDVGRILYVADFCEPGREFAGDASTDALRARAATGPEGLAAAAREVLRARLGWLLRRGRPVHPDSWRAWNAWADGGPA